MSRLATFAVLLLVTTGTSRAVAGPYDALLKHAPSQTNAIVLIDVKRAYGSPLAKKENWAAKIQQSGHGGLGFFPPDSELVAIAAEVNLTSMVRDLQVGFVRVKNLPNFKNLAAYEGGTMSEIAGQLTALSPRNLYFTSFSGDIFAAVYPADRQYVARWLKAAKTNKLSPLSPYLRAVADDAKDNTVTIALDLEDVVDPRILQFGLGVSPVMTKNKGVNQNALAVFVSQAKGLTFTANVSDRVQASITVDFSDESRRYRSVLKDLFLEVLDGYGIYIPGVEQWEAAFVDQKMILSGSMSTDDLRRVVGLFAFPRPEMQIPQEEGEKGPNAAATQRYMTAVGTILDDVKRMKESKNYNKTATWHDNAALQLEQLSRKHVDPLAVDAAYEAARKLRTIAASLRGVPTDVNAISQKSYIYAQRLPYYGWGPHWGGWWGGYRQLAFAPTAVTTNIPQVEGEIAKVIANDQKNRIATWTAIDQIMSDTRRKLADKYKVNF